MPAHQKIQASKQHLRILILANVNGKHMTASSQMNKQEN
jgi:hypothetical protein